ncbi:MAG TPA: site-specific integrase [Proteobacteria bacterium]|nr:site-specific integrase [Pseudomonadota bacterium]
MKFTDWSIKNLKPKEKRYMVFDDSRPGFGIRVSPSGTRTWMILFHVDGKQRWMSIGQYPEKTLTDAGKEYAELRVEVKAGNLPVSQKARRRAQRRSAPTLADLADEYIKKYAKPNKKSWAEDQRMLDRIILPFFDPEEKAKDIRRRDLVLLLEDVGARAPVASNRVRALLSRLFNFALEREILEASPMAALKPLYKERPKERHLTPNEIMALWSALDTAPNTSIEMRRGLRLILATAARPGEVAAMAWEEIEGEWWNLPGTRMKNGKPHRFYLNTLALEIIGEDNGTDFVFPSPLVPGAPINPKNLSRPLRRNDYFGMPRFTPHDLRRTVATLLGEMGIDRLTLGQILSHTDGGITQVYDRHSFDQAKKKAMMKWARRLRKIIAGSGAIEERVIPLKRKDDGRKIS